MKLPQNTEVEKAARATAMEAGLKVAIDIPFGLAKKANSIWDNLVELAKLGNVNCKSDIQAWQA